MDSGKEFGVVSFTLGGCVSNVLGGGFDHVAEVLDVVFQGLLLYVEDFLQEGFGVGNVQLGVGDFVVQSLDFVVVLSGSGFKVSISLLKFNLEVSNNVVDGT